MKIALIGSSPAMLLQALLLSKKFRNIEIHEKIKNLGVYGRLQPLQFEIN